MSENTIYIKPHCPFCVSAKKLLDEKNISYTEIDISDNDALRSEMMEKAGGRHTVPQIFLDGKHIGGCDDLYALEAQSGLGR